MLVQVGDDHKGNATEIIWVECWTVLAGPDQWVIL